MHLGGSISLPGLVFSSAIYEDHHNMDRMQKESASPMSSSKVGRPVAAAIGYPPDTRSRTSRAFSHRPMLWAKRLAELFTLQLSNGQSQSVLRKFTAKSYLSGLTTAREITARASSSFQPRFSADDRFQPFTNLESSGGSFSRARLDHFPFSVNCSRALSQVGKAPILVTQYG